MDQIYLIGSNVVPAPVLEECGCEVIPVPVENWNEDLSPWKAKRVFGKGDDFGGKADSFLEKLLALVSSHPTEGRRYLVGYSLAGLFALYASTRTDLFYGVASVSGSLWFDGFTEYFSSQGTKARKVYLSLGDKEKNSRNERMKRVEECTLMIHARLLSSSVETTFVLEEGNHFLDPEGRMDRAVSWLLS